MREEEEEEKEERNETCKHCRFLFHPILLCEYIDIVNYTGTGDSFICLHVFLEIITSSTFSLGRTPWGWKKRKEKSHHLQLYNNNNWIISQLVVSYRAFDVSGNETPNLYHPN